jgi:F0F1-type ATP synthase assembly protein I
MTDDPNDAPKLSKSEKVIRDMTRQSALAMELPFVIVGAIILAGFLGYLADKWMHTSPWLTIVGGALGFASSMIDIVRRYRPR